MRHTDLTRGNMMSARFIAFIYSLFWGMKCELFSPEIDILPFTFFAHIHFSSKYILIPADSLF